MFDIKLPNFANDLIAMTSKYWIWVLIGGIAIIMLGLATCAKANLEVIV